MPIMTDFTKYILTCNAFEASEASIKPYISKKQRYKHDKIRRLITELKKKKKRNYGEKDEHCRFSLSTAMLKSSL